MKAYRCDSLIGRGQNSGITYDMNQLQAISHIELRQVFFVNGVPKPNPKLIKNEMEIQVKTILLRDCKIFGTVQSDSKYIITKHMVRIN